MNKTLEKLAENRIEDIAEEINALELESEELMGILGEGPCEETFEECDCEVEINIMELDNRSREDILTSIEKLAKELKNK